MRSRRQSRYVLSRTRSMKIRETHRIVVMGGGGVGKTSLVTQFMEGFFVPSYKPTVEDYYRHTVKTPDGHIHTVEIVDTSGTHIFPAMRELSIRSGKAFILVFAVDNTQSFHEAVSIWETVKKTRGSANAPMVLVGNKSDLARQVSLETVLQTKAELLNNCPYIETSAKFNLNVIKLFIELLQQANRIVDGTATPELKRHRKLSRRLSSFSSLPNISLIRRKSSTNTNKAQRQRSEDLPERSDVTVPHPKIRPASSVKGVEQLIANNINNVNCLVDEGMAGIRRAVINGIDTISLSDGSQTVPEGKCAIL